MSVYLQEAFKKLNLLESEDFDLSSSIGSDELEDFLETEDNLIDDSEDIFDTEVSEEEDVEESYDGKIIIECSVCHNKFYKDPEEIIIDEETELCNVDEECPICFSMDGYQVIGKVAPVEEFDEEQFEKESEEKAEDTDIDSVEIDDEEVEIEPKTESVRRPRMRRISESSKKHLCDTEECNEGIVGTVAGAIGGAALGGPLCAVGGAIAGDKIGDAIGGKKDESLDEEFESATIETDDSIMSMDSDESGKVTITTEPKKEESGEEVIAPLTDEDAEEIIDNQVNFQGDEEEEMPEGEMPEDEVEYDVEDFDEESFDDLGESYLKRVYENVNSYKTTKVYKKGDGIVVEGLINFKSGNTKKTSFIFESYKATKTGRVKFIGENAQITRGKKAFTVTGNIKDKSFITESLNYNYTQKNKNGESTRLYGTVRK